MSVNKIGATIRLPQSKREIHRLRKVGSIPGIFYGPNYENLMISLNQKELDRALSHRKSIINLAIEGKGEYEAIFREVQRNPVSEKIEHVDLLGITSGHKIHATVPVKVRGIPFGVKNSGGILEVIRRELNVECLPKDLPEEIELDVSHLNIGQSVHIEDIHWENITILHSPKSAVATVVAPTVIKAAEKVEAEEVKVEGEGAETKEKTESKD
jgi:large subunit ribosomal protein L25